METSNNQAKNDTAKRMFTSLSLSIAINTSQNQDG